MAVTPDSKGSSSSILEGGGEKPFVESQEQNPLDNYPQWAEDSSNPFNWPPRRKWAIALSTCAVSFAAGASATALTTPGRKITEQFDVSDDNFPNSFWPITAWTMAAAIGPMIGMPLLENFGTRRGYLVSYVMFTLFLIPQAVAQNFATIVVTRAIAGLFGGILQNGPEPFVAEMFATEEERDLPVALFILVYEAGVTLGPVWGTIFSCTSWRWVTYSQIIIFGAFLPFLALIIRETRAPIILASQHCTMAVNINNSSSHSRGRQADTEGPADLEILSTPTLTHLFYDAIVRPTHLLLTEPVVASFTLWSAFCTGLVFLTTQSTSTIYAANYNFSDAQVGLVQTSLFVGEVLGFLACLPQNRYYHRSARSNTVNPGVPIPEARLALSIPASFVGLAGGLFWYAWASAHPQVHWLLPTAGLVLVGFGIVCVVTCAMLYLTDAYTAYAGSAVAAVAMGENLLAAWLPLSTRKMYTVLGFGWAGSLLGFVAVALSFAPVVLVCFGRGIRERSRFLNRGV